MPQTELSQSGRFDARLDLIPQEPGVYLMKDASGSIIYVGKAVNLPRRLHSYFCENPRGNAKVLAMISHIADFSYILCENELEALILENNLIKQYSPRYNILLRDDKEYPYIKVTMNEMYPRVMKSFHVAKDKEEGTRYFGPYLAGDLHRALEVLHEIFPLKRCRRVFPRDIGKERPCLWYYIGRCIGPCRGEVSAEAYRAVCEQLCDFLEGKSSDFEEALKEEMNRASDDLQYEEAARMRDRLSALNRLRERQIIISPERSDSADVLGMARNGNEAAIQLLKVREGRMVSSAAFFFPDQEEAAEDFMEAFLLQYYDDPQSIPKEILLGLSLLRQDLIERQLSDLRGKKLSLLTVKAGKKKRWLEMADKNAGESLSRHTLLGTQGDREKSLENLAKFLKMEDIPHRIEAYDIANLGEEDRAASMVVFVDGRPKRSDYRHFKIQSFEGADDYAAMTEVLRRRLSRLDDADFGERPELILLDGGSGHVRTIQGLLNDMAPDIALAGMVKDHQHRTRGLVRSDMEILELRRQLEKGDSADPDKRAEALALLRLLTAIQNEAHRFAQRLHKKLGKKRNLRWSLEEIPGIGPQRRRALLSHFHTLKAISEASQEELLKVPGLPESAASAVYQHFHPEFQAEEE